jgi:hypothetical protein
MVRRVETQSVSVFVVLRHPRQVTLDVFEGRQSSGTRVAQVTAPTVPLGNHFHALVITAVPTTALKRGTTYGYNLTFVRTGADPNDSGPTTVDLAGLNLLSGTKALGYENGALPSFATPPASLDELRIVHASCRLPHAEGPDVFPTLDTIIGSTFDDAGARPHLLCLTGDQIYADDVAPNLLALASEVGDAALWAPVSEKIPISGGGPLNMGSWDLAPTRRKKLLEGKAALTSERMESHLVALAEFVGMYMLVWSDAVWRDQGGQLLLPTADELFARAEWATAKDPDVGDAKKVFRTKAPGVIDFEKTVGRVRRALANVPTLMQLDDHEVTDDWYIDREWVENVEQRANTKDLGGRVLFNALTAYAVFQAWGNTPDQFVSGQPGGDFLDALEVWKGDESDATTAATIRQKLNLPYSGDTSRELVWDYALEWPEFQVVVLDTRTQRVFPAAAAFERVAAASLLGPNALNRQVTQRVKAKQLTLVVSPAPVFGHPWVEEAVQFDVVQKSNREVKMERDYEAWTYERAAFQDFLRELAKFERVVILSGDVHYGFAAGVEYWDQRTPVTRAAVFAQCTSSGLRNEDRKTRFTGDGGSAGAYVTLFFIQPFSKITPLKSIDPTDASFLGWELQGNHLSKGTTSVPVTGTPALERVPTTRADTIAHNPEWRYRIRFARDSRTSANRRPAAAPPAPLAPTPGGAFLDRVYALGVVQRDRSNFDSMRTVVGHNNLGDLTFSMSGASKSVRQALWFTFDEKKVPTPGPFTVYEVPLNIPSTTGQLPDLANA